MPISLLKRPFLNSETVFFKEEKSVYDDTLSDVLKTLGIVEQNINLLGDQAMAGTTGASAGAGAGAGAGAYAQQYADQIKFGVIIVSTVPVLCVYPFIQKYFEKGIMIGAVKG